MSTKTIQLSSPDDYMPRDTIRNYRLIRKLGSGGFGSVWLARQVKPVKRLVAIKLIKPEISQSPIFRNKFFAEYQMLARMNHSSIAAFYDAGISEKGEAYFVMEWVKGSSIAIYCDENKLRVNERLSLFIKCAHAVRHAHNKRILHRDIKPQNVIVTEETTLRQGIVTKKILIPKIIDFGIGTAIEDYLDDATLFKIHKQSVYHTDCAAGTLHFMSPEQASARANADERSDVYSLGATLHVLIAGTVPFDENFTDEQVLRQILNEEAISPSERVANLSKEQIIVIAARRQTKPSALHRLLRGDLGLIIEKCLKRNPVERYQTIDELVIDIENFLGGLRISARPNTIFYKCEMLAHRNHGASLVLSLIIAVASLASAVILTSYSKTQNMLVQNQTIENLFWETLQNLPATNCEGIINSMDAQIAEQTRGRTQDEIALRRRITPLLVNLGFYKEAERFTSSTLKLCRSANIERAVALYDEGNALIRLEQDNKAVDNLNEALEIENNLISPRKTLITEIYSSLGRASENLGKWEIAAKQVAMASALTLSMCGSNSLDYATTLNDQIKMYDDEGQLETAYKLSEIASSIEKKILAGVTNQIFATTLYLQGFILMERTQLSLAKQRLEEALVMRREIFGDEHPAIAETLNAQAVLARVLATNYTGLHDAENLAKRALKMRTKYLGVDHPKTAETIDNLAVILFYEGLIYPTNLTTAVITSKLACETRRTLLGNEHNDTATSFYEYIRVLIRDKSFTEAERVCEEQLATLRSLVPTNDLRLAAALAYFSWAALSDDKPAAAEAAARESLGIRLANNPEHRRDLWLVASTKFLVGESLLAQHKYSDARRWLDAAHIELSRNQDAVLTGAPRRTSQAADSMLRVVQAMNDLDAERIWTREKSAYLQPTINQEVWVDSRFPLY